MVDQEYVLSQASLGAMLNSLWGSDYCTRIIYNNEKLQPADIIMSLEDNHLLYERLA